jgi:hypothetical protein
MSTAHAAHSAGDHAHDDHARGDHAHDFDGEPVQALPADEPRTPSWLPILGLLLFVTAGVGLLVMGDKTDEAGAQAAPTAAAQAAPPATEQPAAPPVRLPVRPSPEAQPQQQPGNPAPAASGAASALEPTLRGLTPEQVQGLQRQFEQERGKAAAGDAAKAPKAPAPPARK